MPSPAPRYLSLLAAALMATCTTIAQQTLFTLLPGKQTGITFSNNLTEDATMNVLTYQYLYNGGGVAVGDINNDGLQDICFTGNMVPDKLYLNRGHFQFEDISATAGFIKPAGWSTGVTMADVNGDGWIDIYVCKSGRFSTADRHNMLYINNGNNTFTEKAQEFGIDDSSFTTQAAFFDFDLDGDLDLFLLNHAVSQTKGFILSELRTQRDKYAGNKLLRNDNGHFTDISAAAGIFGSPINFGLGIMIGDINNDRWPDIFVTNDYHEQDFLYLNNKNGTFTEILKSAMGHTSNFSMGCDMADINNDGWLDLFVADMLPEDNYRQKILKGPSKYDAYQLQVDYGYYHQIMHNSLQMNNGNNTFSEIAYSAGVYATDWSWSPLFADFNNDGYEDLYITNGYRRDFTDLDYMKYTYSDEEKKAFDEGRKINSLAMVELMPSVKIPNYMFQGNADLHFTNTISEWGFGQPSFSNGSVYADLDNDGDLDIVTNNINDTAFVYRNNAEQLNNHYLKIQLTGAGKNVDAFGARVLVDDGVHHWTREMMPTRGYASSVDPVLHFGVGNSDKLHVVIIFNSGKYIELNDQPANTTISADEKNAQGIYRAAQNKMYFAEDVTTQVLNYVHTEEDYTDYKREPLLPYKLSQSGPKMTSGDVNGDGRPDIFICGAKNKKAKLFIATEEGEFFPVSGPWDADSAYEDADALLFDADRDGDNDLYVVSGGNEYIENARFYQDRLYINNGKGVFKALPNLIPQNYVSKSCVRAVDFDNDGDLDLFVGGKNIPGKYPLSPQSFLFKNVNGQFEDMTASVCPALLTAGMINDAVWCDLNKDALPDLIIAGDWTPIRIFINKKGILTDASAAYGTDALTGWWNCLLVKDMDGDGDDDIVAGNRGTNNLISADRTHPATVFATDLDGNGSIDPVVTCYFNDGRAHPIASRDDLLDWIPSLKKSFVYYKDYAGATMETLFPSLNIAALPQLHATEFRSVYLENNGKGKFTEHPLPEEAQWFPVNCMLADDLDGDGKQDLLIAGNNYSIRPEMGRIDAGHGLFLKGGGGNFEAVPSSVSNIFIPGETRSMQMILLNGEKYIVLLKNRDAAQVLFIEE